MLVYDRWGGIVFSTNNYQEGWNGTDNGEVLEGGVYSYKISYLTPNGNQEEHKGKITFSGTTLLKVTLSATSKI